MRMAVTLLACAAVLVGGRVSAVAQPLVPLGDEIEPPLVHTGISARDVEMSGMVLSLGQEEGGAHVICCHGDFEMLLGERRLVARQAVVWMAPRVVGRTHYRHFEVFLWRDAEVCDLAGTVTRGPALWVTLNSSGTVRTSADRSRTDFVADLPVYQRARRIREAMASGAGASPAAVTVIDLAGRPEAAVPEVRPAVSYEGRDVTIDQLEGRSVVTAIGDVYLFRGGGPGIDELELRAEAAVVYLGETVTEEETAATGNDLNRGDSPAGDLAGLGLEGAGAVQSVYLEGDIVLTSGSRMIRASRLYYDFVHDRALILDAVVRMFEPKRSLPIYLRADAVRQLSATEFSACDVRLTTSEFFAPHYHVGAEELKLADRTRRSPLGPVPGRLLAGTFEVKHSTFNLGGVPILYWPYAKGNISDAETSMERVRFGFSDDFGVEMESRWKLFNVLGFVEPEGYDGSLLLDYFSKRGPAVGVDLDYETDDYFGLYRGYYIHDTGEDNLGGRWRDKEPDTENRGRSTFRHRQYLADDWQLTLEASYISDKNFLEEYFEREYDGDKDQETLLELKKQVDNWAFTALLQYRPLDFLTATERLPDFSFRLMGEPLGAWGSLFSENRAGWVRYRPSDRGFPREAFRGGREDGSGTVARGDTRQEFELPLMVGDVKIVPFGSIRGSAWDDTPGSGGVGRVFGTYGLRGSVYAWRAYPEAQSDVWDVSGLKHVVKADVVAWAAHSNLDSGGSYPFDENVEGIDEVDGVSLGLRQRFQTRRGDAERRRTVDVVTFDVELGLFNDAESDEYTNGFTSYSRPENSVSRNYVNTALVYRVNDSTSVASEMNFDLNDGAIDIFTLTCAVERTPRLSYAVGYRYIGAIDSNLLGLGFNYRISEKYILAVREEFDLQRGDTAEFDIGVIRKFPRWYVAVTVALDQIEDDFGMSVSVWPEGLPRAALGPRRFTGLVTSTGIGAGS